ncbi:TPA: MFS transporter [Klebsiella pneumoniae]|uniref:MFS transporter n=1 Tax=Klebsiella pneumoniae TaxID=573 RepID=UPI000651D662|nr:MFS transporter [Klebsiella pneumoniae]HBX3661994.1 MFS transporter [Klebsiella pneumoniae subsp. pneumoniae]EKQ7190410.1 MFS transporter [Klebsiella pneumoniae]EKQ7217695.1 MFS transporter [Klebsiella pneumoniae]EKZ6417580.1 MFS transporter [Klebsiella pneumoniae]EKZ6427286.1 MFS transporter [Klebsiella pneumoniae]
MPIRENNPESLVSVQSTNWSAVLSVMLGVAGMITSELLPVSLLTPMASGLKITEGMAGQSVSLTALVAIFSSLFITTLTRGINRRWVVAGFSLILALANFMTALAPDFTVLLAARFLLGVGMGGFWAMSASLAIKLAAPADIPRALSIIFGGVSVSLVIAAPAGSFLEAFIGWRGVFELAAILGMVCMIWQMFALPSLPAPRNHASVIAVISVMRRNGVATAMFTILLVFVAQMGMLTYIRPLLETFAGFPVSGISTVLLIFGVANFIGTSISGLILRKSLRAGLAIPPLVTALSMSALLLTGGQHGVTILAMTLWGMSCGIVPVAWSTWITRRLGDDAENAGSLQVAVMQGANTVGAAVGGFIFDHSGVTGPLFLGIGLMLMTFVLALTRINTRRIA